MQINGREIAIKDLSLPQLELMERAFDQFLFSAEENEPFEPSFRKDPKQFKRLVSSMISYRKDVQSFFSNQFNHRSELIKQHGLNFDDADTFLYKYNWDDYDLELAQIMEKHDSEGFDLGVLALGLTLGGIAWDYSAADAQARIAENALKVSKLVNKTTQDRAIRAVRTSLELGEDRAALEVRLKKVFINPYRGRFIAQEDTMNAYMNGKEGLAKNMELDSKEALSSQATDKLCAVNGEITPIDKPFSNGFLKPQYHFGCRCDARYFRSSDN